MLTKSRPPGKNGVAHGGVAIFVPSAEARLEEYKFLHPDEAEVLTAEPKFHEILSKIFVIGAYLPPGYNVPRARVCMQHINNIILELKSKFRDCMICLAGDFNQWDVGHYLEDYPDLQEAVTPPTRNNRTIDEILVNWKTTATSCHAPLQSEVNHGTFTTSDHKVQLVRTEVERKIGNVWRKITFRPYNERAAEAFNEELSRTDWQELALSVGSNAKADKLRGTLDFLMDKHFPFKTIRRNEGGLPWFNETAKKNAKRKKAIFRDEGKSERWEQARNDLDKYLEA